MLVNSMASYYELGASSVNHSSSLLHRPTSTSSNTVVFGTSIMPPFMLSSTTKTKLSPEAKALAASNNHKEAERRRRKRINSHFATLRSLLPNLVKTDKASVLGEVVRRVRQLKKATSEYTTQNLSEGDGYSPCLLPRDTDEVVVHRSKNDSSILIASLSCDDRLEFIADLKRALQSVKCKFVKASLAMVGGRTKTILWVRGGGGSSGSGGGGLEASLRKALKVVVDRPPSSSAVRHFGLMGTRMYLGHM